MIEEKPNAAQRFFKKDALALSVNEDETRIMKASKKGSCGRKAKDAFILSIRELLCGLCG